MVDYWLLAMVTLFLLFLGAPQVLERWFTPVIKIAAVPFIIAYMIISRFLKNLPEIIVLAIATLFILLVWSITIAVHLLGRFRAENVIGQIFEKSVGHENIQRVREDLLIILPVDTDDSTEHESLNRIRENAKSRMQTAELIFTLLFGALFIIVPTAFDVSILAEVSLGTVIEVYILVLTPAVLIRIYLLDVLAFSSADEAEQFGLEKSLRWQKGVTKTGIVPFLCVLVSLFLRIREPTYERAIRILRLRYKEDVGYLEGLKKVKKNIR